MSEHTKEPWFSTNDAVPYSPRQRNPFKDVGASICAGSEDDPNDVVVGGAQDEQGGAVGVLRNEDARRIVACVNACQGLTDKYLEGVVARGESLADAFVTLEQERANNAVLREALRDAMYHGLIYWEPNTARGNINKADMMARIDKALSSNPGAGVMEVVRAAQGYKAACEEDPPDSGSCAATYGALFEALVALNGDRDADDRGSESARLSAPQSPRRKETDIKTTRCQRILNPNYVNGMEWMERAQKLEAINAELLEALEAAEQYLAFHSSPGVEPVPLHSVRAAIAKAKGG